MTLRTVLRTNVLHCDKTPNKTFWRNKGIIIIIIIIIINYSTDFTKFSGKVTRGATENAPDFDGNPDHVTLRVRITGVRCRLAPTCFYFFYIFYYCVCTTVRTL